MSLGVRGAVNIRSSRGEFRLEGAGDRLELRLLAAPGRVPGVRRWRLWAGCWRFLRRHPQRVAEIAGVLRRAGLHADVFFTDRVGLRLGGVASSPGRLARFLGIAPLQLAPIPRSRRVVRTGSPSLRRPLR